MPILNSGARWLQGGETDYRLTIDFGIENRALQYLLLLVLREVVELHPDQYGNRGGVHPAIKRVVEAMSEGYLWATEFDIKDFFASFEGNEALSPLPVPRRVGEKVLISEFLTLIPGPTLICIAGCEGDAEHNPLSDKLVKARQGIPPGSAASSFVAEALLADTIHAIPKIGVVVAYIDNFLLLAKTKDDVVSMSKALGSALKAHPAGPFQPTIKHFNHGEPIDFLGHRITPKNGLIRLDPDDRNHQELQKLVERVTSTCALLKKTTLPPLTRQKIAQRLERVVVSRTAWLKLCDGINEIRSQALAQINEALKANEEKPPMNDTVSKTFKLHPDQKEIVEAALTDIKGKTGTAHDTVALEYMAQSYMGTGIVPAAKSILKAEYKKAGDLETFLARVGTWVEQITGKSVTISYDECV
jgi:hypothetical protein